jgi:hypothetical protein
MSKQRIATGLDVGTLVAFYARLVNGSTSPWHHAGCALVLADDVRPRFTAPAAHLAPAWAARGARGDAFETIDFGVLVGGLVERVAVAACTARVRAEMRALAPHVERPRFGGAPRLDHVHARARPLSDYSKNSGSCARVASSNSRSFSAVPPTSCVWRSSRAVSTWHANG